MSLFGAPSPATLAEALLGRLRLAPPRSANEAELQRLVAAHLRALFPEARAEVTLPGAGRIDFMAGRIGIELKVKGSAAEVTRQLWRYAEHPELDGILLVTTKRTHARIAIDAGSLLAGKPAHVLCIGDLLL
jgi:predicted dehydrogenase